MGRRVQLNISMLLSCRYGPCMRPCLSILWALTDHPRIFAAFQHGIVHKSAIVPGKISSLLGNPEPFRLRDPDLGLHEPTVVLLELNVPQNR